MGGNVFENSQRIESKEKFHELCLTQKELLKGITKEIYIPRQIDSKETFGDIDLILSEKYKETIAELIESLNLTNNIQRDIHSGNITNPVISYLYEDKYQIDLIFLTDNIEYAYNFFSYGDHGSLLSTILFKDNLKNSFKGLIENIYKNNGNYKRTLQVSNDYFQMLEFLELDVNKFIKGFSTEEDLFNWISSSPYFEKDIFNPANKNHKHRSRNKKRPFYIHFLAYLDSNIFTNLSIPLPSKEDYFESYTPNLKILEDEYTLIENYKTKVNGDVVSKVTGAKGHEIRYILQDLNILYSKSCVIKMSDEELERALKKSYETIKRK